MLLWTAALFDQRLALQSSCHLPLSPSDCDRQHSTPDRNDRCGNSHRIEFGPADCDFKLSDDSILLTGNRFKEFNLSFAKELHKILKGLVLPFPRVHILDKLVCPIFSRMVNLLFRPCARIRTQIALPFVLVEIN